jgi:hypothetical protein
MTTVLLLIIAIAVCVIADAQTNHAFGRWLWGVFKGMVSVALIYLLFCVAAYAYHRQPQLVGVYAIIFAIWMFAIFSERITAWWDKRFLPWWKKHLGRPPQR